MARATVEVERDGTVPPGEGQIVDSQVWHCSDCGDEREFVQPTCTDGHTEDGGPCPEWACVDCGAALVTGVVVAQPAVAADTVRARIAA